MAVRMEESSSEIPRVPLHDGPLPLGKFDLACVLAARSVLREQAWPMTGAAEYFGASLLAHRHDLVVRPYRSHSPRAFLDKAGPRVTANDAKLPYSLSWIARRGNAAIAEVKTEQVCVIGALLRQRGRVATPRARGS